MTRRRRLARLWRRLRRPAFGRLVATSAILHVAVLVLAVWLMVHHPVPSPPPQAPLIVELPPAAQGSPLVQPEAPAPVKPSPPPAARPASPAPRAPAARPAPPPPAPPAPVAPPPPAVARPVEPAPAPTPPPAPEPVPTVPPAPPAPHAEAVAPPEPQSAPPSPAEAPPAAPSPPAPSGPAESPLAGRQFSLLAPRIEVPPLHAPPSGGGGTAKEGSGEGESGLEREGQTPIPLTTTDPRYVDYFLEIKKRIKDNWVYPQEAIRKEQSGQLVAEFVVRKDGTLRLVHVVHSSGVPILDRYVLNAIRLAAPFPPIPDRIGMDSIPITWSFRYVLEYGLPLFGLR